MEKKYIIGIAEMDKQHSKIFEIAERARDAELDLVSMQNIIVELVNYAKKHLEEEESMLRINGLHDFLYKHIVLHNQFREQAMEIYCDFRNAEEIEDKRIYLHKAASFCENWLLNHIDVEDRKYAKILKT